jgi:hypothetical protein
MADDDPNQPQLDLTPGGGEAQPLPPVVPPQTKAPFTFNQQVNIQNIPPQAWDRLSPDQVDRIDKRRFDWAMERAKRTDSMHARALVIGGIVALVGLSGVVYLAAQGHEVVAAIIGTFLATVVAVVLGNRLIR